MRVTMHGHGECPVKIKVHKIWVFPVDRPPAGPTAAAGAFPGSATGAAEDAPSCSRPVFWKAVSGVRRTGARRRARALLPERKR
jgi:hypothetical protein